jgi:hypothetical protein
MSWGVKVPFLSENVIRCVPLLGLSTSGLFSLGRSFNSLLSWGFYRVHSVSGAGDDYIDLANTYLFVEAQIVDDDDTALWMHSLFSDVSVSLNEKLVSPPTSLRYIRRVLDPSEPMSIPSAPNTHVRHWSV